MHEGTAGYDGRPGRILCSDHLLSSQRPLTHHSKSLSALREISSISAPSSPSFPRASLIRLVPYSMISTTVGTLMASPTTSADLGGMEERTPSQTALSGMPARAEATSAGSYRE